MFVEVPWLDAESAHLLMFLMVKATLPWLNHRDDDVTSCGGVGCHVDPISWIFMSFGGT